MWKAIDGYKWPYRINEEGVVQKFYEGEWITLKPYLTSTRARVKMRTADNKKVDVPLVWLMADAFMGGRRDGYAIVHKNGSKLDCAIYNLKFVKRSEVGRISCYSRRKAVQKIDRDGNVLEVYASGREAAKKNFMCQNAVSQRCLGQIKDPFALTGFSFRFERTQ